LIVPLLATVRERFVAWLNGHPDDWILSRLFGMLIAAAMLVLAYDYYEMAAGTEEVGITESEPQTTTPNSPSFLPSILPTLRPGGDHRMPFRKPDGRLAEKMTFDLAGDGKLIATGLIVPGSAEAFKAEVDKRGSYI
jgi:hypothetical protein